MVEFKERELVIRIETDYPECDLVELQESLIYAMSSIGNDFMDREPMYPLFTFMRSLLLSSDQMLEFKKWKNKVSHQDS